MRTLVHLSDLHFGRVDPALVEPLIQLVGRIRPDVVVVSGDLTQRARTEQFKEARRFLDSLPAPQIVVPGNHDVPLHNVVSRFLQPLDKYRRYITDDLEPFYVDDAIAVLGINTARSLTIKRGRVSYEPNSLGGGCPMQAKENAGGFVSYAEKIDGEKVRGRSEKFFDHFSQARLFWSSQSAPEKAHIVNALRFELGKVEVIAIRERMVGMLAQVDKTLADRVAQGLGLHVPAKLDSHLNHSVRRMETLNNFNPSRSLARSTVLS